MPTGRMRVCALARRSAIAGAALLAGVGAARADVITRDPTLPPQAGAYLGTGGGAGCFPAYGVCAEPGKLYGFTPISSVFDAAGQELLFDTTYTTTVTNLAGVPVGTITFDGEMGETVFGRTGPDETGAWRTEITSLDLDGMLTGPLAGISGGIGLDPGHVSDGETAIAPVAGGYRIASDFSAFVELTMNTVPPVTIDRGPLTLTLLPVGRQTTLSYAGHDRPRAADPDPDPRPRARFVGAAAVFSGWAFRIAPVAAPMTGRHARSAAAVDKT